MGTFYVLFSLLTIIIATISISIMFICDYSTYLCDKSAESYYIPKIIFYVILLAISIIVDISFEDAIFLPSVVSGFMLICISIGYYADRNSYNFLG